MKIRLKTEVWEIYRSVVSGDRTVAEAQLRIKALMPWLPGKFVGGMFSDRDPLLRRAQRNPQFKNKSTGVTFLPEAWSAKLSQEMAKKIDHELLQRLLKEGDITLDVLDRSVTVTVADDDDTCTTVKVPQETLDGP